MAPWNRRSSGGAQSFLGHFATGFLDGRTILLFGGERRDLGEVLLAAGADRAGRRLDDQKFTLAAEQRDLALPARIDAARRGGEIDVGRELALVLHEQRLVGGDELLDEGAVDDLEVRHHPAAILEHPVGADADELPLARQVGIERETAAGDGAVVALAMPRSLPTDGPAGPGEPAPGRLRGTRLS